MSHAVPRSCRTIENRLTNTLPAVHRAGPIAIWIAVLMFACNPCIALTLVAFDFDDGGNFELDAEVQHTAVGATEFRLEHGSLTDYAGQPGRAIGATGFTTGNTLTLAITMRPGYRLDVEYIAFDLRVSASGPKQWALALNGEAIAAGDTDTRFQHVDLLLDPVVVSDTDSLEFALSGTLASSNQGTLRLDNLEIGAQVSSIPLPASLLLLLSGSIPLHRYRS